MDKLNIAFLSTMKEEPTRLDSLSDEMIEANIVDELAKKGHKISLFAASSSFTPLNGKLIELSSFDDKKNYIQGIEHNNVIAHFAEIIAHDIIHDASTLKYAHYYASVINQQQKALAHVTTNEWDKLLQPNHVVLSSWKHMMMALTAASPFFVEPYPHPIFFPMNNLINITNPLFVYPDIDLELYQPNYEKEDYLVWVGKFIPEAGVNRIIEACKKIGKHLRLVDASNIPTPYLDKVIKPLLNETTIIENPTSLTQFSNIVGKAQALISFPNIQEPFNLDVLRALALGTPVLANPLGAHPELIVNGKSGFIVPNSVESLIEKIKDLDKLSPENARNRAKHFKKGTAADAFLEIYNKIINDEWGVLTLPFAVR